MCVCVLAYNNVKRLLDRKSLKEYHDLCFLLHWVWQRVYTGWLYTFAILPNSNVPRPISHQMITNNQLVGHVGIERDVEEVDTSCLHGNELMNEHTHTCRSFHILNFNGYWLNILLFFDDEHCSLSNVRTRANGQGTGLARVWMHDRRLKKWSNYWRSEQHWLKLL